MSEGMTDYKLVPKSTVDELAQFIRKVDGNHKMGAGALAEKICERFRVDTPAVQGEPVAWCFTDVNGKPKELTDSPETKSEQDLRIYTPLYAAPQLVEQQPAPDEYLMGKYPASRHLQDTCAAALAAYHDKQEGKSKS